MAERVLLEQLAAALAAAAAPRIALTVAEASSSIGVSRDFFDEHVKPELRLVRRGRLILVPVRELERWVEANAERTLGGAG